jgi:hypothetical protein
MEFIFGVNQLKVLERIKVVLQRGLNKLTYNFQLRTYLHKITFN